MHEVLIVVSGLIGAAASFVFATAKLVREYRLSIIALDRIEARKRKAVAQESKGRH